jgi:hypothetical protein
MKRAALPAESALLSSLRVRPEIAQTLAGVQCDLGFVARAFALVRDERPVDFEEALHLRRP